MDVNRKCNVKLRGGNTVDISGSSCLNPPLNLNKNWKIDTLNIEWTGITLLKENTFQKLWNLKELVIDNNQLEEFEDRTFYGLINLRNLSLSQSKFTSLPPRAFEGLVNLSNLRLKKTLISSVQYISRAIAPGILPNLKTLYLGFTKLGHLKEDDLIPMSGSPLEDLDLHFCGLLSVDLKIFSHIPKLRKLSLFGNKQLSKESIIGLMKFLNETNVETLDLSKLRFPTIPTDVLKLIPNDSSILNLHLMKYESTILQKGVLPYLPRVVGLVLDKNKVVNVEDGAFDGMPNLKTLSMKNNFLPFIPRAIAILTSLETLNLAGKGKFVNYFSVSTFNFSNNTALKNLDLSRNKIDTIGSNGFIGAYGIERLTMIGCNISRISTDAFGQMPNLKYLILTHNSLIHVDSSSGVILPNVKQLQFLSVSRSNIFNNFESSGSKPFGHLEHLQELDISDAKLDSLHANLFYGLKNLQKLIVRKSSISDWTGLVFSKVPQLKFLDLSSNTITGETLSFTKDLEALAPETAVDLSFNPFSCDCKDFEFLEWIQSNAVSIVGLHGYQTYTNYLCESSKESLILQEAHPCYVGTINIGIVSVFVIVSLLCTTVLVFIMILKYRPKSYISNAWFHLMITSSKSNNKFVYDAFISYCSSDFEWINYSLLPALENEIDSMKLCIYERDFLPGREISSCILESISKSRKIILILTNSFVKSQWCLWELHMAQYMLVENKRNDLVIILLEELDQKEVEPMLQYLITTRIYLAWSDDPRQQEVFWTKLRAIISGTSNPCSYITN